MKVHNLDSLRLKIRFGLTSSPDSDRLLQSKLRYTISCKMKKILSYKKPQKHEEEK